MKPHLKAVIDAAYEAYKSTRPSNALTSAVTTGISFIKGIVWAADGAQSKLTALETLHNKVYTGDEDEQFDSISKDITTELAANPFISQGSHFKNIVAILELMVQSVYNLDKIEITINTINETIQKLPVIAQNYLTTATQEFFKQLKTYHSEIPSSQQDTLSEEKFPKLTNQQKVVKEVAKPLTKNQIASIMFAESDKAPQLLASANSVHSFHKNNKKLEKKNLNVTSNSSFSLKHS